MFFLLISYRNGFKVLSTALSIFCVLCTENCAEAQVSVHSALVPELHILLDDVKKLSDSHDQRTAQFEGGHRVMGNIS